MVKTAPPVMRFAPSPTGLLHVGNARVALANWLIVERDGGTMILRLDDTDAERSTNAYADAIAVDLQWLGLGWSHKIAQSDRLERYHAAAERLKEAGRLYPCYETPEELDHKRKSQLASSKPPVYDRAALALGDDQRAVLEGEGRKPHWRFRLADEPIAWEDGVRGPVSFAAGSMSDPVLVRADGRPLYTLSSVVDDIELGITHVIRGEDHVANTATQLQVFAALGAAPPVFSHLALLLGPDGQNLAKRLGSLSLQAFREAGVEAMAVNSLLARLGTSKPVVAQHSLEALAKQFELAEFSRATAKLDPAELAKLSAKILQGLPFNAVKSRLGEIGLDETDEAFWLAVRGNMTKLADAADWWQVVHGPKTPVIEDASFTAKAAELLPPGAWDQSTWQSWTRMVKTATKTEGHALFRPLRLALTGLDHGPELKVLLPLIGRARAKARLLGKTA